MFSLLKQIYKSYIKGNAKTQLIYETLFLFLSINCFLLIACLFILIKSY